MPKVRPGQPEAAQSHPGEVLDRLRYAGAKAGALFGASAVAVLALKGRGIAARPDLPQALLIGAELLLYAGVLYHARSMHPALWVASSVGLVCLRLAWTAGLGVVVWVMSGGPGVAATVRQTLLGYPPAAYIPMLLICAAIVLQKPKAKAPAPQQDELPRWAAEAIERQAGRAAEPAPKVEEPQIVISWAALLRQFPDPAVQVFEKQIERAPWEDVRLSLSTVLPQLEQGRVTLSLRDLLSRLPARVARALAQQLSASMAEGVVELPLEEIVAQISPTFLQAAKPAPPPKWWTEEAKEAINRIRFSLPAQQAEPVEPAGGKAQ